MRLAIQLDEADIRQLIVADNNCYSEGQTGVPDWILGLLHVVVPDLAEEIAVPKKHIAAATKGHKLRSFEFSRDEDVRYPQPSRYKDIPPHPMSPTHV